MCYSDSTIDEEGVIAYTQRPIKNRAKARVKKRGYVNGFSYPEKYVVKQGENEIDVANWSFLPSYINSKAKATEFRKKYLTLNAKAEEIFDKTLYKNAILSQRCIVPTSAFFENRHVGKETYPYMIRLKDQPIFCFAGIYNNWTDENGEEKSTYSILTTGVEPGSLMARIHNSKLRQPMILSKELENVWLDPGLTQNDVKDLMTVADNTNMVAHSIAKLKKGVEVNLEPFEYPELALLDL